MAYDKRDAADNLNTMYDFVKRSDGLVMGVAKPHFEHAGIIAKESVQEILGEKRYKDWAYTNQDINRGNPSLISFADDFQKEMQKAGVVFSNSGRIR